MHDGERKLGRSLRYSHGGSPSTEKNSKFNETRKPTRLWMYQLQARDAKPLPGPSYLPVQNKMVRFMTTFEIRITDTMPSEHR